MAGLDLRVVACCFMEGALTFIDLDRARPSNAADPFPTAALPVASVQKHFATTITVFEAQCVGLCRSNRSRS